MSDHAPAQQIVLGRGFDGIVWRARPIVAVKTPRDHEDPISRELSRQHYGREKEFRKQLENMPGHPCVASRDVGATEGIYMEKMVGGSLEIRLAEAPPSAQNQAWLLSILKIAEFFWDRGYVHGDLRPCNLLFDEFGNIKVCDFGRTALFREPLPAWNGNFWDGWSETVTIESEQFAFGSLMYCVLTGREPTLPPFDDDESDCLDARRLKSTQADVFEHSEALVHVINQCWSQEFTTIEELKTTARDACGHV